VKTFKPEQTLEILNSILDVGQAYNGINYLRQFVENVANTLDCRYVLIGHSVKPENRLIQTDVVWANGSHVDNFTYELAGTPCHNVISGKRVCIHSDRVVETFPDDVLLADMGVEAYIGSPMLTADGELVGILVLLDDKPLDDPDFYAAFVEFISIRAGAEIEKSIISESLKQQVDEKTIALKKANVAKDLFLSIIAHDMRSPFNGLLGSSAFLLEEYENCTPAEHEQLIRNIYQSSEALYSLLNNLLQWAMAQSNQIKYEPDSVQMLSLVQAAVALLSANANEKNISIELQVSDDAVAYCDQNMVDTILRNLLSNAIKFTRTDGCIKIKSQCDKDQIKISVIDNGVGISEKNLPHLFEIDKKISEKGTAGETGSGLGLVLCKEFAEINKGSITVESTLSKGSTFTLILPKSG